MRVSAVHGLVFASKVAKGKMRRQSRKLRSGFTLFELLFTVGLIGVLLGVAVTNLRSLDSAANTGAAEVLGFLRQVRARAMAATSAYKIAPSSAQVLAVYTASTCSSPMALESSLTLKLPLGASFTDTGWEVCFSSRGFPDSSPTIDLQDTEGGIKTIQVFLGGAVKVI